MIRTVMHRKLRRICRKGNRQRDGRSLAEAMVTLLHEVVLERCLSRLLPILPDIAALWRTETFAPLPASSF
jgi:hypothetical protein